MPYELSVNSNKNKTDADAGFSDAHKWWRNFYEAELFPRGVFTGNHISEWMKEHYNIRYSEYPIWCLVHETEEDALAFVLKWS